MRKYLLTILLFSLLFTIVISTKTTWASYTTIVQDYPLLPACKDNVKCRPGQTEFGIPQYIKYIYIFSLGIVGVIALLAIIMAAFQYVTSAGNPQKAADAKDKIISALLGMILLLGSYVLLKTINPDLLKLKTEKVPIGVAVPKSEGSAISACRITEVAWQTSGNKVNAGETIPLVIRATKECKDKTFEDVELWLRQERGGGDGSCLFIRNEWEKQNGTGHENASTIGWPHDVAPCIKIQSLDKREVGDHLEFYSNRIYRFDIDKDNYIGYFLYSFNVHCFGTTGMNSCPDKDESLICNFHKINLEEGESGEELFILKGEIQFKDQPKQFVPELKLWVKDNR